MNFPRRQFLHLALGAALIAADTEKWAKVIRAANITAE